MGNQASIWRRLISAIWACRHKGDQVWATKTIHGIPTKGITCPTCGDFRPLIPRTPIERQRAQRLLSGPGATRSGNSAIRPSAPRRKPTGARRSGSGRTDVNTAETGT